MARPKSLTTLSIEALLRLRDDVGIILSKRADEMKQQLSSLMGTNGGTAVKRGRKPGRPKGSSLKGRKVAPKYRSKKDSKMTWAGRGATPRWMRDEMKAGKLKKDAFLIK